MGYASLATADLVGTESVEEVLARAQDQAERVPKWVLGRGWDQAIGRMRHSPTGRRHWMRCFPTGRRAGAGGRPAVWANAMALEVAGFTSSRGLRWRALRHPDGELTGVLVDRAADSLQSLSPSRTAPAWPPSLSKLDIGSWPPADPRHGCGPRPGGRGRHRRSSVGEMVRLSVMVSDSPEPSTISCPGPAD